jgi:mannose-1-phosphate guanylyltransferase
MVPGESLTEAVLITGGQGSRLRPLTSLMPKRRLPIGNVRLELHILRWLAPNGLRHVRLGTSPQEVSAPLPDPAQCGLESVAEVREPEPLGTGGFLRLAAEGLTERFLAMNGDILTDAEIGPLLSAAEAADADLLIASRRVADASRFGLLVTGQDGRLLEFAEKSAQHGAAPGTVNSAVYIIHPRAFEGVPPGVPLSLERDLVPRWVEQGRRIYAHPLGGGYWLDVSTRESYLAANEDVALGRSPARGGGTIARNLLLGAGCLLADDAHLSPGCCLGDRVRVDAGARVERSVLLEGAQVGAGAQVADSVLGPGARVAEGAIVEGALLIGDTPVS